VADVELFEDDDVPPLVRKRARGGETGDPGPDDGD
jgi:hypothetical protein